MTGTGIFAGGGRAVLTLARDAMRASVRGRLFGFLVVVDLVYLAFFRTSLPPDEPGAAARFLDFAFTGATALLVVAGLALGLAPAAHGRHADPALRLVGPAATFWGRALGHTLVLIALGLVCGAFALVHHVVRFGGPAAAAATFPLREHARPEGEASPYRRSYLFEVGARHAFTFPFVSRPHPRGGRLIAGRAAPRLTLLKEGGGPRSDHPVRVTLRDPDGTWQQRQALRIRRGRPFSFDATWSGKGSPPRRLEVEIENAAPEYGIAVAPRDVVLIGEERSLVSGLLVAGLQAALFAALFAAVVQAAAGVLGRFAAFLVGVLGLLASTSFRLLDLELLRELPDATRLALLEGLSLLVPDFSTFDPPGLLARGFVVPWSDLASLAFRLVTTIFVLGVLLGVAEKGRRR